MDKVLPFGLRSAPLLFTALADALQWIMIKHGVSWVEHYLDDFITMGAADTKECESNLAQMVDTCERGGVPIEGKSEGPATMINFLRLELDTVAMEICLPKEKLDRLKTLLAEFRGRKACRKRELLSLIGSLSHASKAVRSGRAFLRRLIDLSMSAKKLDHFIRLSISARSDIEWWHQFASSWNGVAMMIPSYRCWTQREVTSDASGKWGCGAFCGKEWFQLSWMEAVRDNL